MKVTVIGCGPSGLAAVHAAIGLDADVRVIAPKKKTPQNGPIFLQRPIPGISTTQPTGYIRQIVVGGSILGYRLKLYGDVNTGWVADEGLAHGIHTWPIPETYDRMWELYHDLIEDQTVSPGEVNKLVWSSDLVINAASAKSLCWQDAISAGGSGHQFLYTPVAIMWGSSYPDQPDDTVIYNADPDTPWVRSNAIFGVRSTEYPMYQVPVGTKPDLVIKKPTSNTCNCHPRVLRVGRFGKWDNHTWIDNAYYDTRTAIISMQRQDEWKAVT